MLEFFKKIFQWVLLNLASVLGCFQVLTKLGKEICTALINLAAAVLILFPKVGMEGFQSGVLAVREWFNKIDEWINQIKEKYLIPTA